MAILAVAAGLRLWNLTAGLPYSVGVDEPQVVDRAVAMMHTGDYHPHFFDYPGLFIHTQLVVAVARFLLGVVAGEYRALDHFTAIEFYPTARFVTACLGVATVWLTARVGARWGRRESLIGALVMAVMPMHVRESHYALTDVPVTFLVTLTLLATLRAHERPTLWRFAQAGAAAGLAAATKYNGGLVVLLPLLAVWPSWTDAVTRVRAYVLVVGTATSAFLLTAPYTVLDLPTFLREFARLHSEYNRSVPPTPPWLVYAKHLRLNFGWPALVAALAGVALSVVRLVRSRDEGGRLRWLLLLAFPVVYFWMLSGRSLIFGRYLLPLVPMLCVLCGIAWTAAWDAIAARRVAACRRPRRDDRDARRGNRRSGLDERAIRRRALGTVYAGNGVSLAAPECTGQRQRSGRGGGAPAARTPSHAAAHSHRGPAPVGTIARQACSTS